MGILVEDEAAPKLPDNIQTLVDECNTKHAQVVQGILSGEYESRSAQ